MIRFRRNEKKKARRWRYAGFPRSEWPSENGKWRDLAKTPTNKGISMGQNFHSKKNPSILERQKAS